MSQMIPKFKDPFVVTAKVANNKYAIKDIPEFQLSQIPYEGSG